MEEFLVSFACIVGKGCAETTEQYFNVKPEVREVLRRQEKKVERILPTVVVQYGGPLLLITTKRTTTIKLSGHWSWKGNTDESSIVYGFTF